MKVLQIANDFCHTKVHANLFRTLDSLGVSQTIFNPVREASLVGKNAFEGKNSEIVYAHVVKPWHKYFYHIKRWYVFRQMLKRIDCRQFSICHASTLLTDGGLAYLLWEKYKVPYVVAVRNTDINGFMDRAPHTHRDARNILLHAERIFFISEGLKQKFEGHKAVRSIIPKIRDKFVLLPNGIDDVFLDNISTEVNTSHKIIYVGDFSDNKNVVRLIQAVLELRKEKGFEDTQLTIIGGGKAERKDTEQIIDNNPNAVKFLGKIYDKHELIRQFRQHSVFAMPSIHETFGLVYLEALSQNLACLYTKSQGIDGLFDDTVGVAVDPKSVDCIKNALRKLLLDRVKYGNQHVDFSQFRWRLIGEKYLNFYLDSLGIPNANISLLTSLKKWVGVIRNTFKRLKNNRISYGTFVGASVLMRNCRVGKHCYIATQCIMNNTHIGNYTCIAPHVQIGGMQHSYWYPSISPLLSKEELCNDVNIGHDVWIAAGAIIAQGVTIGNGAVIGANSFVNKDVPPYAIVVGTPARILKYRFSDDVIEELQKTEFWNYEPNEAKVITERFNEKYLN